MPEVPATHAKHPRIDQFIRQRIVEGRLKPGDRLPTWDELEQRFNVSRGTVLQAIRRLKRDGFVITRGRGGMYVAQILPHRANIGIVFAHAPEMRDRWSRFEAVLEQETERAMAHRSGQLRIYHRVRPRADNAALAQLLDDVTRHRLGGVILVHVGREFRDTPLIEAPHLQRVVISYAADVPGVPSVYPDKSSFLQQALDYLQQRGRQRPALITTDRRAPEDDVTRLWEQAFEERGMKSRRRWFQRALLHPPGWARRLAEMIVVGDADERPDALIVTDDHLTQAVAEGVRDARCRVPEELDVVSWGNFPNRPDTAVPVTWIGADTSALIETCLNLIERQQRGESVPPMTHGPVSLHSG